MPRLFFLALLGLTGLTAAHAQPTLKSFSEPRFFGLTAEQILSREPTSPNPYLAFLPEGVAPDYTYWNARMALESYRRALVRPRGNVGTRGGFSLRYTEQEGARGGVNNTLESAEMLPAFTGGRGGTLELSGDFGPAPQPVATRAAAVAEAPAGQMAVQALALAAATPRYTIENALIGDGPYGATTGDVDLYVLDVRVPRSYVKVSVDTPSSDLDPVLALYDAAGVPLALKDDDSDTDRDPSAMVLLEAPGQYYLFVYGYSDKAWPPGLRDVNDVASGYGAGSTGAYVLDVALQEADPDAYGIVLQAGDVLAVTTPSTGMYDLGVYDPGGELRMRSVEDLSFIYPESAPFLTPAELDPGNAAVVGKTAVIVASTAGRYTIMAHGEGPYRIHVQSARPGVEGLAEGRQTLFVDFDGATIVPSVIFGEGRPFAALSPLATFLQHWGLMPADEDAVIDAVMAALQENLRDDLRRSSNNPNADLVLLNSRDHPDPFGAPGVSRLIIGGTIEESGIETIGIASSIDPGNFDLEDTAIILLDLLSAGPGDPNSLNQYALASGRTKAELVGLGIGNVAAHEAGHFLGLFHTDQYNDRPAIQDQGGNMDNTVGIGTDRTFGTADDVDVDFVPDVFVMNESLKGVQDQANVLAFGLSRAGGTRDVPTLPTFAQNDDPPGVRVAAVRGGAPESEGYTYDFGDFRIRITGTTGNETLWVLPADGEMWREAEPGEVALLLLGAGVVTLPSIEGMSGTDDADAQAGYARLLRVLGIEAGE